MRLDDYFVAYLSTRNAAERRRRVHRAGLGPDPGFALRRLYAASLQIRATVVMLRFIIYLGLKRPPCTKRALGALP
jgi:hypothetical protein